MLLPPAQDQRFMVLGGGPDDATNATGSTSVIDMRDPHPQFRPGAAMSLPRMHLNAVLLPDRTVFVSGGALAREERVVARLESEIYEPATDTWRIGATASIVRLYHSVALLLPDGRVVAAGGNPPPYGDQVAWEPQDENEELRLEVYSPPYLFAGPRPVISAVPTEWTYGQPVEIGTTADVTWLSLIRPDRPRTRSTTRSGWSTCRSRGARGVRCTPRRPDSPQWPLPGGTCCSWSTPPGCRPSRAGCI